MLFAGLWRRILACLVTLGSMGISVTLVKVKAHQDPDLLEPGSDMQFQVVGNDAADKWAKKGALSHVLPEAVIDDFLRHRTQNLQVLGGSGGSLDRHPAGWQLDQPGGCTYRTSAPTS